LKKDTFIYGVHPVLEALYADREIEKVIVSTSLKGQHTGELRSLCEKKQVPLQYVPCEWFNKIARVNHQGIIAYQSVIEYHPIGQILPMIYDRGETPFLLILDRITDVRNFGSIARTAECAGVHAIIVPSRGHALINSDAVKTSAGALNTIPVCREDNLKETIDFLKNCGLMIVAATEKATTNYTEVDMSAPVALIMGSEEDGVSPAYLKMCDVTVRIPLYGEIASLNVSVAAGVVLYEIMRQRTKD
jgi:23S rRNA (guanosine2251-2'-O)-methyltransferase